MAQGLLPNIWQRGNVLYRETAKARGTYDCPRILRGGLTIQTLQTIITNPVFWPLLPLALLVLGFGAGFTLAALGWILARVAGIDANRMIKD